METSPSSREAAQHSAAAIVAAIYTTYAQGPTYEAKRIRAQVDEMIAQGAPQHRLRFTLEIIDKAIQTLEADHLAAFLVGGPALEELRAAQVSLQTALE